MLINTSQLENPPFLPQENLAQQKQICSSLCYFIKKYDESIYIAIEDCVKLVEKIAQFLIFRGEKQLQVKLCAGVTFRICARRPWAKYAQSTIFPGNNFASIWTNSATTCRTIKECPWTPKSKNIRNWWSTWTDNSYIENRIVYYSENNTFFLRRLSDFAIDFVRLSNIF